MLSAAWNSSARSPPRVWTWLEPFRRRVLDDLSPPNRQAYVEQQLALSRMPNYRSWGVKRDGELGGLIALLQPRGAGDPSAIAHLVFRREFFGFATAVPAIRQAFGQAFDEGITLIRGEIFEDNGAIRSLVLEVGARLYGTLGRDSDGLFCVKPLREAAAHRAKPVGVIGFALNAEDLRADVPFTSQRAPREAVSGPSRIPDPEAEDPPERPQPGLPGQRPHKNAGQRLFS